VQAPLATLERREGKRDDRAKGMAREQWGHRAFTGPYDVLLDTSTCTPEEGAAVIRDYMRAVPRM